MDREELYSNLTNAIRAELQKEGAAAEPSASKLARALARAVVDVLYPHLSP